MAASAATSAIRVRELRGEAQKEAWGLKIVRLTMTCARQARGRIPAIMPAPSTLRGRRTPCPLRPLSAGWSAPLAGRSAPWMRGRIGARYTLSAAGRQPRWRRRQARNETADREFVRQAQRLVRLQEGLPRSPPGPVAYPSKAQSSMVTGPFW